MKKVCFILTHAICTFVLVFILVAMAATTLAAQNDPSTFATKGKQLKPIDKIAFGSCNNQRKEPTMWRPILQNQPDMWIWLGDIIYADTEDMSKKKAAYDKVKNHPGYKKLSSTAIIHGVWDDHDYAKNDCGKEYGPKNESQQLLLDFLDVNKADPVWDRAGVYNSYCYNEGDKEIKIILLDNRYFRDELIKTGRQCFPNPDGDVLGEAQWAWLEKELSESTATVNIIGSGFQVLPKEHQFEKWANFPKARARLLRLLNEYSLPNVFLISGDRHVAECSKINMKNGSTIHEITSSGLTHTWPDLHDEPNQYRFGKFINKKNFAVMEFDWVGNKVSVSIKGEENVNYQTLEIRLE